MSTMNHSIFRKFALVPLNNLGVPGLALLICLLGFGGTRLHAQAVPTASSGGDLQIGAMYNYADTDYRPDKFNGYGFYATFDFRYHVGIEGEYHQLNDPDPKDDVFERTYEIGPRYVLRHGRYNPYAKLMFGRGVFQYPLMLDASGNLTHTAQLAYNIGAIGVGLDYRIVPGLNARVEYEYQHWFSFPPNGLTPQMLSVGVAYRFH
ncbi:MAG: outer membrane beta-barrel protein [Edaphobacter sp.]